MKHTSNIISLVLVLSSLQVLADTDKNQSLSAYGKIGIMGYTQDSDLSLENLGSRIGFRASRKYPENKFSVYTRGEWAFNAIDNTSDLSIGPANNIVSDSNDSGTFRRRLGFVGFDLNAYGDIRLGKQWSIYSDISGFTDRFNIFGGTASGTYNLKTDGGQSGTGRVSKGVAYRNSSGSLHYGLQAKLIQNKQLDIGTNSTRLTAKDSLGFSLKNIFTNKMELGFAFNQIELEGDKGAVPGFSGGNSWSGILGIKMPYNAWVLALTLNKSKNHEIDDNEEVFDGAGFEVYAHYQYSEFSRLYLGHNDLSPSESEYTGEYHIQDTILGYQYQLTDLKFFLEAKLSNSKDHTGEALSSKYAFGTYFYF